MIIERNSIVLVEILTNLILKFLESLVIFYSTTSFLILTKVGYCFF